MKVFVAGASGAIGRPLIRELLDRGHEVTGLTRQSENAKFLEGMGATPAIGDAADAEEMTRLVKLAAPQAIISELTRLPRQMNPKKLAEYYAANNAIRLQGTRALLDAARAANVERFVSQSAAFWYRPTAGPTKSEKDPFDTEGPEPVGEAARTMLKVEEMVRNAPDIIGTNLRYATFYGPGTWYSRDGEIGRRFKKWQYPIIGTGDAVMSFVHIVDAARATALAMECGRAGDFNVADDEPAVANDWMPTFAEAIGARKPMKVPVWLARLMVPDALVHLTINARAASNERIKTELRWQPCVPSWRTGFREGLAE